MWGQLLLFASSSCVKNERHRVRMLLCQVETVMFECVMTVWYLPVGSQRPSTRLLWLKDGWIQFWLVFLQENQASRAGKYSQRQQKPGVVLTYPMSHDIFWLYHLWTYAHIVSNVNVNHFSLVPQTLLQSVYLQQGKKRVSLLIGEINTVKRQCVGLEEGRKSPCVDEMF